MPKNLVNSILFLALCFTASAQAFQGVDICTPSKNSIAQTLAGTWTLQRNLTSWFKPEYVYEQSFITYHTFTFFDDNSPLVRWFFSDLKRKNKCAYLIGRLNFPFAINEEQDYFALISEHGVPAIAVTDSPGCSKTKTIMIATGDHKKNDILYIHDGRGMLAYTRVN